MEFSDTVICAFKKDGLRRGRVFGYRVIYEYAMLKEYRKILKRHAEDVYGVGAHTTLSLYTLLAVACIVVPVTFFIIVILLKLF